MNVKIYKYGEAGASMIYPYIENVKETEYGILKLYRKDEPPYTIPTAQIRDMDVEF